VGLCFSGLLFLAGTGREGLGVPTRSRAISRTTLLALKVFFFFRGMRVESRQVASSASSHMKPSKSEIILFSAFAIRLSAHGFKSRSLKPEA